MTYTRWICLTTAFTILFTATGIWIECRLKGEPQAAAKTDQVADSIHSQVVQATDQVMITGAVHKAGLYRLPVGSQVRDLIALAGGTTAEARLESLNPERRLQSGEVLYVPGKSLQQTSTVTNTVTSNRGNNSPKGRRGRIHTARIHNDMNKTMHNGLHKAMRQNLDPPLKADPHKTDPRSKSISVSGAHTGKSELTGPINLNQASFEQLERLPGVGPELAQRILDWRIAHGDFKRFEDLLDVKGIGEKKLAQLAEMLSL
jgi:competence protein ComEA